MISSARGVLDDRGPASGRARRAGWYVALTLASAALAAAFGRWAPTVTDDGRLYLELAGNLLHTGRYVRWIAGGWHASTARLPGYPLLLAALYHFAPFARMGPLVALQWLLLLGTAACAAWLARLIAPPTARPGTVAGAAMAAFGLTALCPFLAMYAAAVLTEVPATFCTMLALCCGIAALRAPRRQIGWWAGCGAALAAGIQIRPDTGLVLAVVSLPLLAALRRGRRENWNRLIVLYAIALLPVGIWTVRNWVELRVFRPLVTAEATEVGEAQHPGFDRWAKTWLAGYRGVENVLDNVPDGPIEVAALPPRALGQGAARARTLSLIAAYNRNFELTPALDAQFGRLAAERIHRRPARYYLLLPLSRMISLWFSPRVEILPVDDRWWPPAGPWQNDRRDFLFTVGYLLLNAAYLLLALYGLFKARPRFLALLAGLVAARTVALGAYISCEPRYVLELYPLVLVWAAWGAATLRQSPPTPVVAVGALDG